MQRNITTVETIVKSLHSSGMMAQFTSQNFYSFAIIVALVPNKSGLVKTLFGNGATLENDNGMELLKCAFLYGEMDVMKMLISNGVDVNVREPTTNNTVLHQVCRNSDAFTYFKSVHIKEEAILIQPLEWLISKGFDINVRNNLGYTAIHQIAYRRYINVAKILLDAGADVNIASKYGYTPLLMAFASLDPYGNRIKCF
ncbi:uncharacterized protein LOC129571571 [Sitodiplosis mosellana]|uniref:uncharacterized protein LOC129571571 n=1 Tax=Sitodiplosis mosellana TaxID=263140 RepID=UPI0024437A8A|nr:uncharacterized protein LOC129571571 [Sitodiplosis mosellana]